MKRNFCYMTIFPCCSFWLIWVCHGSRCDAASDGQRGLSLIVLAAIATKHNFQISHHDWQLCTQIFCLECKVRESASHHISLCVGEQRVPQVQNGANDFSKNPCFKIEKSGNFCSLGSLYVNMVREAEAKGSGYVEKEAETWSWGREYLAVSARIGRVRVWVVCLWICAWNLGFIIVSGKKCFAPTLSRLLSRARVLQVLSFGEIRNFSENFRTFSFLDDQVNACPSNLEALWEIWFVNMILRNSFEFFL